MNQVNRLEVLRGLVDSLASAGADLLPRAGDLYRRCAVLQVDRQQVDDAIRSIPRSQVEKVLVVDGLEAKVVAAAEESFEGGLSEVDGDRDTWMNAAFDSLLARDRAQSILVAGERWAELNQTSLEAAARMRQALADLDRKLKPKARWFTSLNLLRRKERDLLDAAHREAAWWFAHRADCDDLLGILAGNTPGTVPHVQGCADCRRDLEHAAPVQAPRSLHFTSEQLWRYSLGTLPDDEAELLREHADTCEPCAELMRADEEGEEAITEALEDEEVPEAAKRPAARRTSGLAGFERKVVEDTEDYRITLIRERRKVRLVVRPQSRRGLAAVAVSFPPQTRAHKPTHTPDGLEFELGEPDALAGKTVRVMVKLTQTAAPIHCDIEL
jgi:hypothetical protein